MDLEAVLLQKFSGEEHLIIYISRKTPTERDYDAMEQENLAIKWATEELCYYLTGWQFTHHCNGWQTPKTQTARFLSLQGYSF